MKIFESLKLREIVFRNRIWMPPMCQYSSTKEGIVCEWHKIHYGSRAALGVGCIIVEATAVTPAGRISPYDLGIWSDDHIKGLTELTEFMKSQGCVPGIQLAHAGRKASTDVAWRRGAVLTEANGGWPVVGPSPIAFSDASQVPHELNELEIQNIISDFKSAAERAMKAGFQVIELHAAHGYLMHQFLSPLSNHRKDQYGGSLENRMRLPLKVAQEIRKVLPNGLPLLVRISATDWVSGGWDLEQSLEFCRELKKIGVDMIDVSTGGLSPLQKIDLKPLYQVEFSESILQKINIPTAAVGLITTVSEAEFILADQKANVVLIGRELLRNPSWVVNAAREAKVNIQLPLQYERAR